jgi:hypothetical protein
MKLTTQPATYADIQPWRERYRRMMNRQVVHDSLHTRAGWTESQMLEFGGRAIGYASVAVGGPWRGTRTLFEFFVEPAEQTRLFHAFETALTATRATALLWQTNDPLLSPLAFRRAHAVRPSRIVFEDRFVTTHTLASGRFRRASPADTARIFPHAMEPVGDWLIEIDSHHRGHRRISHPLQPTLRRSLPGGRAGVSPARHRSVSPAGAETRKPRRRSRALRPLFAG